MRYDIIHMKDGGAYAYDKEQKKRRTVTADELIEEIFKHPLLADIK